MVQEFGTIVTFGVKQQDSYLRAILPACWRAGANGFLWWCLRDITANVYPYLQQRFESTLGLVDDHDRVKPGLEQFIEFALLVQDRPAPEPADDAIGIYWPKHFYPRDNPQNPGNRPRQLSRWLVMANYLLRRMGRETCVVRGDQPLDERVKTLVIPGTILDALEVQAVEAWVRKGHTLIWHGPDPVNWGHEYLRLFGARPVDYRTPQSATVDAFGEEWTLGAYPRDMRVEIEPDGTTVLASDQDGLPVVLSNAVDQGRVVYALPIVEAAAAEVAQDREARDRWQRWYAGVLEEATAHPDQR
jgi:hypothetical protein